MGQHPKIYPTLLLQMAEEMRSEADNLSPRNDVYPAGTIRRWAERISRIAGDLTERAWLSEQTKGDDLMSAKIDLLPCPFCGNTTPEIRSNGIGDFFVICEADEGEMACGACSSQCSCETESHAASRWNKRT